DSNACRITSASTTGKAFGPAFPAGAAGLAGAAAPCASTRAASLVIPSTSSAILSLRACQETYKVCHRTAFGALTRVKSAHDAPPVRHPDPIDLRQSPRQASGDDGMPALAAQRHRHPLGTGDFHADHLRRLSQPRL